MHTFAPLPRTLQVKVTNTHIILIRHDTVDIWPFPEPDTWVPYPHLKLNLIPPSYVLRIPDITTLDGYILTRRHWTTWGTLHPWYNPYLITQPLVFNIIESRRSHTGELNECVSVTYRIDIPDPSSYPNPTGNGAGIRSLNTANDSGSDSDDDSAEGYIIPVSKFNLEDANGRVGVGWESNWRLCGTEPVICHSNYGIKVLMLGFEIDSESDAPAHEPFTTETSVITTRTDTGNSSLPVKHDVPDIPDHSPSAEPDPDSSTAHFDPQSSSQSQSQPYRPVVELVDLSSDNQLDQPLTGNAFSFDPFSGRLCYLSKDKSIVVLDYL